VPTIKGFTTKNKKGSEILSDLKSAGVNEIRLPFDCESFNCDKNPMNSFILKSDEGLKSEWLTGLKEIRLTKYKGFFIIFANSALFSPSCSSKNAV